MVEALTSTKCGFIFWIAETMWCLSWFCCWFSSFLQEVFFLYLLPFPPFLKTNNSKIQLHQGNGRYKEPQTLYVYLLPSKSLFYIFICYLFAYLSSCNSSYPSGVAVAQRLAPFGVARFLYADVEKKPENGEPISIYKAAVSIVSDFKWNTLPSPVDTFFGFF